jgi:hypothetical protein
MHYISRILIVLAIFTFAQTADAQPPTRRGDNNTEKKEGAVNISLPKGLRHNIPIQRFRKRLIGNAIYIAR